MSSFNVEKMPKCLLGPGLYISMIHFQPLHFLALQSFSREHLFLLSTLILKFY